MKKSTQSEEKTSHGDVRRRSREVEPPPEPATPLQASDLQLLPKQRSLIDKGGLRLWRDGDAQNTHSSCYLQAIWEFETLIIIIDRVEIPTCHIS